MTNTSISFLLGIVKTWKESLKLLIDKRFWLVTFKATKETYRTLFRKFWWLIIFSITSLILVRNSSVFIQYSLDQSISVALKNQMMALIGLCYFFLWSLLEFIAFLIVRPSLFKKENSYFLHYWSSYVWFLLVSLSIHVIEKISFVHKDWNMFWLLSNYIVKYILFLQNLSLIALYMSPFLCIYTFFYLDSKKTMTEFFYCIKRTFKMFINTYPFLLIIWYTFFIITFLLFTLIIRLMGESSFLYLHIIRDDCIVLFLPFFFCLINNLYTKQVHDHYDLYT